MFEDLDKLFLQKYNLHTKKFELLKELNSNNYIKSLNSLNRIHIIINQEILNNRKIIKILGKSRIDSEFVVPICLHLKKINLILKKENSLLYHTNVVSYSLSKFTRLVTGKKGYFKKKVILFRKLAKEELELYMIFFELSKKLPRDYQIDESKIRKSLNLVIELQRELIKLKDVIGNSELVKKQGEKILVLIGKIQKTEIYGFIEHDVVYIKGKAEYIVKHPKENKLAYVLTTIYIIAPLTFEMTGAILFFRYLGKYTINKVKKVRKK